MLTPIAGWTAGMVHVLAGPDHLAAVAPLAAGESGRAWRSGLWWGLGHASGVLAIGIAALWARDFLPWDAISSFAERLVGAVLIVLGLWGLRLALTRRLHAHEHTHDGTAHTHFHFHGTRTSHAPGSGSRPSHSHSHLSFGMGVLHAFAGGTNLLGVLPALVIPGPEQALIYLAAFAGGSIAAMAGFSWLIQASLAALARGGHQPYPLFLAGCSVFAIALGVFWLAA